MNMQLDIPPDDSTLLLPTPITQQPTHPNNPVGDNNIAIDLPVHPNQGSTTNNQLNDMLAPDNHIHHNTETNNNHKESYQNQGVRTIKQKEDHQEEPPANQGAHTPRTDENNNIPNDETDSYSDTEPLHKKIERDWKSAHFQLARYQ